MQVEARSRSAGDLITLDLAETRPSTAPPAPLRTKSYALYRLYSRML